MEDRSRQRRHAKAFLNWTFLILIVYAAVELLSLGTLGVLKTARNAVYLPVPTRTLSEAHRNALQYFISGNTRYLMFHSLLGWTIKPNGRSKLYRANSKGIRADREYASNPSEDVLRVMAFGDSYTHCDNVRNEETWEEKLSRINGRLEVLNFGVPGYGLDQAFLRFHETGKAFKSHIVLIGFTPENTHRNVNVFRPFYLRITQLPLTKPRFIVRSGKLFMVENSMQEQSQYKKLLAQPEETLPKLGEHDYYFQTASYYKQGILDFSPSIRLFKLAGYELFLKQKQQSGIIRNGYYNRDAEAFRVTLLLIEEFTRETLDRGCLPIILILPERKDLVRYHNNKTKVYEPFSAYFSKNGYLHIDLMDAFAEKGAELRIEDLFVGHYSPLANELVACHIGEYLQRNGLTDPVSVSNAVRALKEPSSAKLERQASR